MFNKSCSIDGSNKCNIPEQLSSAAAVLFDLLFKASDVDCANPLSNNQNLLHCHFQMST